MQSTTSIPEADKSAQVKRLMDDTHNRLNEVIHVMTPPIVWQKDLLMIMVPRWLNMMQDLSRRVSLYMPYGAYDLSRDSSQQSRSECLVISDYDDFSLLVPEDIKSAPNMAVKHMKYQQTKGFGKKFTTLTLSNGNEMPVMGLGTWMLNGDECVHMVMEAFRLGYRHIDGAEAYGNDREIGVAIQHAIADGIVDRKDIFIANKISNEANAGYENTKQLILTQLKIMGLKYFDLYMIHSPMQDYHLMEDTWKAMQELCQQGIVKAIGLSNFGSNDLRRVLSFPSLVIKPMVIQNKLDIYHVGKQIDVDGDGIISLMKEHDIRMVGYSYTHVYIYIYIYICIHIHALTYMLIYVHVRSHIALFHPFHFPYNRMKIQSLDTLPIPNTTARMIKGMIIRRPLWYCDGSYNRELQ